MNYFVDIDIGYFQIQDIWVEGITRPMLLSDEKENLMDQYDLWTMYFDGAISKEGIGAGILLIDPSSTTFKLSFTLLFTCTNNVAEYEALLIGLRLSSKHRIESLRVIGDFELIICQIKSKYVSKNQRLKQYRNAIWDELEKI